MNNKESTKMKKIDLKSLVEQSKSAPLEISDEIQNYLKKLWKSL